jgi:hypothetical protein
MAHSTHDTANHRLPRSSTQPLPQYLFRRGSARSLSDWD